MAQANVNIRMDEEVKRDFDRICNDLGFNMSVAINVFAKKVIREQRIPFEISIDPFYSKSNVEVMEKSAAQLGQGKTVTRSLKELEDMENE